MNNEKDYVQFLTELKAYVEECFEGKVTGEICTSVKNNGVSVTGLLLKGEEERVAPNFYLDRQFVEWMRGIQTLEEIGTQLCRAYQSEVKDNSHLISELQFSWEEFRRNVFMRLVNLEKNRELLETIPYREFLDLAVVYYYNVPISKDVTGTMVITKEHLELLGITGEELHQAALMNSERFQPVKVRCMEDLLYDLGRKIGVEVCEARSCYPYMFVMTNSKGMFGAVSMVFEAELERLAKRIGKSFFILPSSVHEVILVPEYREFCLEYFAAIVRETNATQVDATEVLSDSIYFYDKDTKNIRRVA